MADVAVSSPMHEVPDHLLILVDEDDGGPVDEAEAEAEAVACWCGCPYSKRSLP